MVIHENSREEFSEDKHSIWIIKNRMIHVTNVEIDEKVVPSIYQFSVFFITLKTTKYL